MLIKQAGRSVAVWLKEWFFCFFFKSFHGGALDCFVKNISLLIKLFCFAKISLGDGVGD